MKCYYHTRHIPREHLRLDDPWGKAVENNRLCDTLDEPVISEMQKYHIDIIETRAVWAEIEKEEGVLDFSAVRERVDKIRQAGIGVGIFPWFQHPPAWKKDATRLQCLEHGKESTLISLWDPELLKIYDRLYGALAAEFRDEIDFLYVGVYGDYGEVFFPHGVTHYKFSPPHGHPGLYCGDVLARADWKNYLKAKYRTLPALCTAWAEDVGSFDENLMQFSEKDNIAKRMDLAEWYTGALMHFCEEVCKIVRKYFPDTRAALPIGHRREPLEFGQIKSVVAKIAGKYNMAVRWTSVGEYKTNFALSHICSRRLSSAAKFYGAGYGVEASLYLAKETASPVIFETLSNNASIMHNDPGNIMRAGDVYRRFRAYDECYGFVCDTAVFYPIEAELCVRLDMKKLKEISKGHTTYDESDHDRCEVSDLINLEEFFNAMGEYRKCRDYEICDSRMIDDGYLKTIQNLVILPQTWIPQKTAEKIKQFAQNGGNVAYQQGNPPKILETGEPFQCGTETADLFASKRNDGIFVTECIDRRIVFDAQTDEIRFIMKDAETPSGNH